MFKKLLFRFAALILLIMLVVGFNLNYAALAQESGEPCNISSISASYGVKIGAALTLEELTELSNELALDLATCRNAGTEVGSLRSNPAPAYTPLQITDAFAINIGNYADLTDWMRENYANMVVEGKIYYGVAFTYQCTLSVDEVCEDGLHILSAVGQSGAVYEYETIYGAGLEFSWEVFGGGSREFYTVFAVDEGDAQNFLIRVTGQTPDYQERVKFFTLGDLVVPE